MKKKPATITARTTVKIMSYLLTTAMIVGGLSLSPLATVEVQAAEKKNINLNVGNDIEGIINPKNGDTVTSWTGTTVYYGNKAYYVLDKNGDFDGHSSKDDHMLLLSKGVLASSGRTFDDSSSNWTGSDIETYLNGVGFYNTLNVTEQGAIGSTTINNDKTDNGGYTGFTINSTNNIFLLDLNDVQNTNYGFSSSDSNGGTRVADPNCSSWWWLRSPGNLVSDAAGVSGLGNVNSHGPNGDDEDGSARPAFNLNLSSVLFSSASGASKSSSFAATTDSSATSWNLTLQDGTGFTAERKTGETGSIEAGTKMNITVTAVPSTSTNAYTQTSAMLLDGSNTVICYGRIKDGVPAAGDIEITIPSSVPAGIYTMKVFAEDVNSTDSSNLTDYASNMAEIPNIQITAAPSPQTPSSSDDSDSNNDSSSTTTEEAYVNPLSWYYEANPLGSMCLIEHQGPVCVKAFNAATPKGYKEAFSFNLLLRKNGIFQSTYDKKAGKFVINIPKEFQKAGRTFALIGIDKFGNTKIFTDNDLSDETFATTLDMEGYAFSLIYMD